MNFKSKIMEFKIYKEMLICIHNIILKKIFGNTIITINANSLFLHLKFVC